MFMVNNKKGQTMGIAVIVAIFLFIVGIIMVNFLKDDITTARIGLDCSNSAISDATKLTCLAVDVVVPYFIVTLIAAAGGIITARMFL